MNFEEILKSIDRYVTSKSSEEMENLRKRVEINSNEEISLTDYFHALEKVFNPAKC